VYLGRGHRWVFQQQLRDQTWLGAWIAGGSRGCLQDTTHLGSAFGGSR